MENMIADWSHVKMKRDAYSQLLDAVVECNYPKLYGCLKKYKKQFNHDEAYHLCSAAIASGCTVKAFDAIVAHCKPTLEEFVDYRAYHNYILPGYENSYGGLVQEAAGHNRGHLLRYLLDHGCSPNARGTKDCSALEAALYHHAFGCVSVLEARDDVDFTVTETIRHLWGSMGLVLERDSCFRIIAGRLLGEGKGVFHKEIPLLPGMNVGHAADHENWPLVCRMLREEIAMTEKQGKDTLGQYFQTSCEFDPLECGELLEALFTACPKLLRCEHPRYALSLCMLCGDEAVINRLRPWVEQLPGREIVLCGHRLADPLYDICACLERWDERMGMRLQPVLRRNMLLPVRSMAQATDEDIRFLLERCAIRGTAKVGQLSRLTIDVLQMASPGLLAELCQKGKAFAGEEMELLLQYCEENVHLQRLEKRNILLAYYKKEVDYEL